MNGYSLFVGCISLNLNSTGIPDLYLASEVIALDTRTMWFVDSSRSVNNSTALYKSIKQGMQKKKKEKNKNLY